MNFRKHWKTALCLLLCIVLALMPANANAEHGIPPKAPEVREGRFAESPCPPKQDHGQFTSWKDCGVKAAVRQRGYCILASGERVCLKLNMQKACRFQ